MQEIDDRFDHGDFAVVELPGLGAVLRAVVLQLAQDAAPAQFKPHLDVRVEVVIAPDAADDVVAFKKNFQIIKRISRIPRIRIRGVAGHAAQPDQKEEAAPDKCVNRIDVERMLRQKFGEILRPAGVAVEVAVRIVGDDFEFEVVRSDDPPVVVLVETALFFHFFGGLGQFAFPEQAEALRVIERLVFRILIDILDHHESHPI